MRACVLQEQQRQGSGGSLMLFKHSIVVVDEQDRAWPVQVRRCTARAGQEGHSTGKQTSGPRQLVGCRA